MWCAKRLGRRTYTDVTESESLDGSSSSDSGENYDEHAHARTGYIRVIGEEVDLDDDNAVVVLVFSRGQGCGGNSKAVKPCDLVTCAREQASKIFLWDTALDTGFEEFPEDDSEPVSQDVFQRAVRTKVVHTILSMGLKPSSFESIDGDETYLKVGIAPDGHALCHMAACYRYHLPLTREAYSFMDHRFAGHPPGKPPKNYEDEEVFAYHEYSKRMHGQLQPFRDVDLIRIVMRVLGEHLNFRELEQQKVISRYFPAAKHERILELHVKWVCGMGLLWCPEGPDDSVRDYFGEEVAFFFEYYAFYIRMLALLALVAVAGVVLNSKVMLSSYFKLVFATFLSLWAMAIQVIFQRKTARARQRWGMDAASSSADPTLPDYRPELEGTRRQAFQRFLSYGCIAGACLLFSFIWGEIALFCTKGTEAIATSLLIRVCSILWGNVVPLLAKMHNHRTQTRKTKSMTVQLAVFKLFLYLSPFLRTAFVANWTQMTCAPNLHQAAEQAFNVTGWPTGADPEHLDWLHDYRVSDWATEYKGVPGSYVCIWGCVPQSCATYKTQRNTTKVFCKTDCFYKLRKSLDTLYVSHVLFSTFFLMVAIGFASLKARQEIASATKDSSTYTFLQFQAKCDEACRYQYLSWGGSYIEDFLEVVLGFALMACFGMVRPVITVWVFLSQAIEYKLLAYRMTHVTARPYPTGSQGIEMWQRITSVICILSVLINAGLAVCLLPAFYGWPYHWKCLIFLGYSLTMIASRQVLEALFLGRPNDVSRVEDFNLETIGKVARESGESVRHPSEVMEAPDIDIGLQPADVAQKRQSVMDVTSRSWRLTSLSLLDNM